MPDKAHARNAKARAEQQHERGSLSEDELDRINRKADKILDERPSSARGSSRPPYRGVLP
jgi:hypothetical protein